MAPGCRDERGRGEGGRQLEATKAHHGCRPLGNDEGALRTISRATLSRRSPLRLPEAPSPVCSRWPGAIQAPHTTARSPAPGVTWAWKSIASCRAGSHRGQARVGRLLAFVRDPPPPSRNGPKAPRGGGGSRTRTEETTPPPVRPGMPCRQGRWAEHCRQRNSSALLGTTRGLVAVAASQGRQSRCTWSPSPGATRRLGLESTAEPPAQLHMRMPWRSSEALRL